AGRGAGRGRRGAGVGLPDGGRASWRARALDQPSPRRPRRAGRGPPMLCPEAFMADVDVRTLERALLADSSRGRERLALLRRAGRGGEARALALRAWEDARARCVAFEQGEPRGVPQAWADALQDLEDALAIERAVRAELLADDPSLCFAESCGRGPLPHHHAQDHERRI